MSSPHIQSRAWLCVALLIGFADSASAQAVAVDYDLRSLAGPSRYEYTYTVSNLSFASQVSWFSVDFDTALFDEISLSITSVGKNDWAEQILASAPGLPAQYDAYRNVGSPLAIGQSEGGFSVAFTWLGAGTPGSQGFTIWNPSTLEVALTGTTAGLAAPVPEPTSALLSILGIAFVGVAVRRTKRVACLDKSINRS